MLALAALPYEEWKAEMKARAASAALAERKKCVPRVSATGVWL